MENQDKKYDIKELNSYYVAEIGNRYIQNNKRKYFRGKSEIVKLKNGLNAVVTLRNPNNSDAIIYINNTAIANISDAVVTENIYYSARTKGDLIKSKNVVSSNQPYGRNIKAYGEVYYGENIEIYEGISTHTSVIPPYENLLGNTNGSVILYPGMEAVIEIYLTDTNKEAEGITSFSWWEEPIQDSKGELNNE